LKYGFIGETDSIFFCETCASQKWGW